MGVHLDGEDDRIPGRAEGQGARPVGRGGDAQLVHKDGEGRAGPKVPERKSVYCGNTLSFEYIPYVYLKKGSDEDREKLDGEFGRAYISYHAYGVNNIRQYSRYFCFFRGNRGILNKFRIVKK